KIVFSIFVITRSKIGTTTDVLVTDRLGVNRLCGKFFSNSSIRLQPFQACQSACSLVKTPEKTAVQHSRGGDVKQIVYPKTVPGSMPAGHFFGSAQYFGQRKFSHFKKSPITQIIGKIGLRDGGLLGRHPGTSRRATNEHVLFERIDQFDAK